MILTNPLHTQTNVTTVPEVIEVFASRRLMSLPCMHRQRKYDLPLTPNLNAELPILSDISITDT